MPFVTNYVQLKNDFIYKGKIYIDGWKSNDDTNENGHVLASIDLTTKQVEFLDEEAQFSAQVNQFIRETIDELSKK